MIIEKINDKEKYMNLLLDADPSKDAINKYINKGEMYGLIVDNKVVCEIMITKVDNETCELKNLATLKDYQGQGYASKLIEYSFNIYRRRYKRMIVGTSENMVPFYVLNGFTKYHHTVKNFFIDNYEDEIWDGNMQCIDMYYYSKEFSEND